MLIKKHIYIYIYIYIYIFNFAFRYFKVGIYTSEKATLEKKAWQLKG